MSLINWIFDIYQHTQLTKARDDAAEARREAAAIRGSGGGVDAQRLEQVVGQLALATHTVQRMMVEKGLCTHEEFAEKLREVDLEDGRADGRLTTD